MNKETRAFSFEVRAEESEQHGTFITGTPIVFEQATDLGWCQETISRQALAGTDLKDVRFLVGHNTSGIPLARSRNNTPNSTMQLIPTENGLDIRVDLDTENNAEAKALYSAVKRGDMSGMSFMFTVDKDSWDDIESDYPKRTVEHISRVLEVSAVAFPAYPQTSIQCASEDQTPDGARASLESARKQLAEERAEQEAAEAAAAEQERRRAALERLNNLIKEVRHDGV